MDIAIQIALLAYVLGAGITFGSLWFMAGPKIAAGLAIVWPLTLIVMVFGS